MKADFATRLRHRVTIEERIKTQNATTGAIAMSWRALYEDVPAEVLTGAGREARAAGTEIATTTARITVRWLPLANPQLLRILWDAEVYAIKAVSSDPAARRWLRFECIEGAGDGR